MISYFYYWVCPTMCPGCRCSSFVLPSLNAFLKETSPKVKDLWGTLGSDFRLVKEMIAQVAIPNFNESDIS